MSLGFQNAGFEIIAGFDNWKKAVEVYKENFKHDVYEIDLKNKDELFKILDNLNFDMIIGGPPCQDFSIAGKRDETCGRADLTLDFTDIIVKYMPKWIVMENVQRIEKSETLKVVRTDLKLAGYGFSEVVLNAKFCNVPQDRKRFFLIGKLGESDQFMNDLLLKYPSKKALSVREYFGEKLDIEYYYRHPWSYNRRAIYSIDEPSPTIRGVNRPVPPKYKKHKGDAIGPGPDLRPLTTKERMMIQTFPESFILEGTKTNLEQMVGNAVPVKLGEHVGKSINNYINQAKKEKTEQSRLIK